MSEEFGLFGQPCSERSIGEAAQRLLTSPRRARQLASTWLHSQSQKLPSRAEANGGSGLDGWRWLAWAGATNCDEVIDAHRIEGGTSCL